MDREPHRSLLKTNPNRSVLLECSGEGQERVIKRFRAQSWWRRLGDRARARGEYRVLQALRARGVAVPRPLELCRVNGAWELSCELIPGAMNVTELLERETAPPGPAPLLAARLGELLARAHAAGTDHADLHAGNLVVDGRGRPWLIDFTHARVRADLGAERMRRDVVNLAADARERVPLAVRRRFFVAWWRALPEEARSALASRAELAARIEREAREHRRRQVRRHADRWLRGYDSCRNLCVDEASGLVLRKTTSADERTLIESMLDTGAGTTTIDHPLDPGRALLVVEGDEELREWWLEMGRAADHDLPAARPVLLLVGEHLRCAFELPAAARPSNEVQGAANPRCLAGLGRLHGALHDRGFRPADPRTLWASPAGDVLLGPGSRLETGEFQGPAQVPGVPLDERGREIFIAAFLSAQRGPTAEIERLRRRLADG